MDPFALARRQQELDRAATARFPALFARKRARLLASPHGFLRGSAPLFYEMLAARPDLGGGPSGDGWIVGDMHIENMGAYRTDEAEVAFDLNDFDDATVGPLRFDVLRLATSVILSGRSFGETAPACVDLGRRLVEAYLSAREEPEAFVPPMTTGMLALVEKASRRAKRDLLDGRTPGVKGSRRFVRGERYLELTEALSGLPKLVLEAYIESLGGRAPNRAPSWVIEDAAQRIAGTGSLGRLRIAVLVQNDTGDERILDFKEAASPSLAPGEGAPESWASRVALGAAALVERPPKLLAPVALPARRMSFLGRQLTPQEDKLDLSSIRADARDLPGVAARVGYILGRAHARALGATRPPTWSADDASGLIDRAIELAGLHEAVYLAYARVG